VFEWEEDGYFLGLPSFGFDDRLLGLWRSSRLWVGVMSYSDLRRALRGMPAGIFLASMDASATRLTLHGKVGLDVDATRIEAQRALVDAGVGLNVYVKLYCVRDLAFPKSIEHLLASFPDKTIYDPTMIVSHARSLLAAAMACRVELGKGVRGIYFNPIQRTLFLSIRSVGDPKVARDLEQRATRIIGAASGTDSFGATPAVQPTWALRVLVGRALKDRDLVAVDAASVQSLWRIRNVFRSRLLPSAVAVVLASLALPASAARNEAQRNPAIAQGIAMPSTIDQVLAEFGVLTGLSIFAQEPMPSGSNDFAIRGMQSFFGEPSALETQMAQRWKWWTDDPNPGTIQGQSPGPGS
jgi:hypothetical protein